MLKVKHTIIAAAAAAMVVLAVGTGAVAAPIAPAGAENATPTAATSLVTSVQYYRGGGRGYYAGGRGYYGGRYYGRWRGPVIGLGVGTAIVAGAIIANEAYRPRRGYYYDTYAYNGPYYYPSGYSGDPRKVCAEHFRSFEWNTGLYTTYGGERKLCPYLRD
jgi:BA14K-like protein